jgi:hypothetical protein
MSGLPSGSPAEWAEQRIDGELDEGAWAACVAAEPEACAVALRAAQARRAAVAAFARPPLPAALREKLLAIPQRGAAGSAATRADLPRADAAGTAAARAEATQPAIPFPSARPSQTPTPSPRGSWWRPAVAALLAIGIGMWALERSGPSRALDGEERMAKADAPSVPEAGSSALGAPVVAARSAPAAAPMPAPAAPMASADKPAAAPVVAAAAPAPVVASAQPAEAANADTLSGNRRILTVMPPANETTADRAKSDDGVAMRETVTKSMAMPAHQAAAPGAVFGMPAPAPIPAPAPDVVPAAPSAAPSAAEPALAGGSRQLADQPVAAAGRPAVRGESVTTQNGLAVGAGAQGGALRASADAKADEEAAPGAVAALPAQTTSNSFDQAAANPTGSDRLQKVVDETGAGPAVLSSEPEIVVAAKDAALRDGAEDKKHGPADAGTDTAAPGATNAVQNRGAVPAQGEDQAPGSLQAPAAADAAPAAADAAPAAADAAPGSATGAAWAERNDGHLAGHLTVTVLQRANSIATVRVTLSNISSPAVRILAGAVTLVATDAQGAAVWRGQARPATVPADGSAQWTWTTPLADGMTWTARWAGVSATTK